MQCFRLFLLCFLFLCGSAFSVVAQTNAENDLPVSISVQEFPNWVKQVPLSNMLWFIRSYGLDFSRYGAQLGPDSFTEGQIKLLIRRAYEPETGAVAKRAKLAAIYALQYSVYAYYSTQPDGKKFHRYREILFSEAFLSRLFPYSPRLIAYVPESLGEYKRLALRSVIENPRSFDWVLLRYKLDPEIQMVFYDTAYAPEYKAQFQVMPYVNQNLAGRFLSENGLLLSTASPEVKADLALVYKAVFQDDRAIAYASEPLQILAERHGVLSLGGLYGHVLALGQSVGQYYETASMWLMEWGGYWLRRTWSWLRVQLGYGAWELMRPEFEQDAFWVPAHYVLRDQGLISEIEKAKGRMLLDAWCIAETQRGRLFVVQYQPLGSSFLGGLILEKGTHLAFADFEAMHSLDGDSIWRYGDRGEFGPRQFQVRDANLKGQRLLFDLEWRGKASVNRYKIEERGSELLKHFLSY